MRRTKTQALKEVLTALDSGNTITDSRGRVYQQEFGQAFYDMLKESLESPDVSEEASHEMAQAVVRGILADMTDRRGLRHQWDQIDEDIRQEIRDTWAEIARKEIQRFL